MKRTKPMRRTRINPVNEKRKRQQYERNFKGPYAGYDHAARMRLMGCAVPQCKGHTEAAHQTARGMGGAKGSWRDLVPLCVEHHDEFDHVLANRPALFKEKYGIDLVAMAVHLARCADDRYGER